MPIPTAKAANSITTTATSIPSLDFPFVFINITPARYDLHNNTTCGSTSTLLTVDPANVLVRETKKHTNSLKIQYLDRLYTIKSESICTGYLGNPGY
ncbi:MAG TPA: hypothetical protein HPP66_11410 [Planctomycetes bacterium]|nr:hypothetical protein [Planctomycetota bacterium]